MKGISTKSIVSAAGTAPLPFSSAPAAAGYRNLHDKKTLLSLSKESVLKKAVYSPIPKLLA